MENNNNLRFLLLLFYYDREQIVKGTLESIKASHYKNFEVAFIDDTESPLGGSRVVDGLIDIKYYHTKDTQAAKEARGGSNFGAVANSIMLDSDCDVVIPICDDDGITPWYLGQLNKFYTNHPEIYSSYCDVIVHDPSTEKWSDVLDRDSSEWFLNTNHHPHCGGNSKDSSQMSFRMSCVKEGGVRWKHPLTACLDFHMWNELYIHHGPAVFNGIVGAIKGVWPKQLGARGDTYGNTE